MELNMLGNTQEIYITYWKKTTSFREKKVFTNYVKINFAKKATKINFALLSS